MPRFAGYLAWGSVKRNAHFGRGFRGTQVAEDDVIHVKIHCVGLGAVDVDVAAFIRAVIAKVK